MFQAHHPSRFFRHVWPTKKKCFLRQSRSLQDFHAEIKKSINYHFKKKRSSNFFCILQLLFCAARPSTSFSFTPTKPGELAIQTETLYLFDSLTVLCICCINMHGSLFPIRRVVWGRGSEIVQTSTKYCKIFHNSVEPLQFCWRNLLESEMSLRTKQKNNRNWAGLSHVLLYNFALAHNFFTFVNVNELICSAWTHIAERLYYGLSGIITLLHGNCNVDSLLSLAFTQFQT